MLFLKLIELRNWNTMTTTMTLTVKKDRRYSAAHWTQEFWNQLYCWVLTHTTDDQPKPKTQLLTWTKRSHRRTGQFFLGALRHLCPKKFSTAPEKTAVLTCKITLPDSPHPVIISKKIHDFGHLARRNEFRCFSFNRYQKYCFLIHFWLLASAEKSSFCPKNNGFARVMGGSCSPQPTWLVRLWTESNECVQRWLADYRWQVLGFLEDWQLWRLLLRCIYWIIIIILLTATGIMNKWLMSVFRGNYIADYIIYIGDKFWAS